MKTEFLKILPLEPHDRGYAFQDFLNRLFAGFGLSPRSAYRLVGEQIDGSFILDADTYLVEAKWENTKTAQPDLLVLREKVEAKAAWARGAFISYSGFSAEGIAAFSTGRSTNLIGIDGLDLHGILDRRLELPEVIRRKVRLAAQTGKFYVPVHEIFP